MARIPIYNEGQRLNPGSPVAIASSGDARIVGDAISGFGQTMARFAQAASAFDEKAREEENKINLAKASDTMRSELYKQSLKAQDTYANNPLSDGTDIYDAFSTAANDRVKQIADGLAPEVRGNFINQANQWKQAHAEDLANLQRKRRLDVMGRNINDKVDTGIAMVRDNPGLKEQALVETENFIHSLGDELMPADKKEAYIAALPRRINEAQIEGYKSRGEFETARKFLTNNPMGYDKKELEVMFDSIDTAENKKLSKDWTELRHGMVLEQEAKKKMQEANASAYLPIAVDANADPAKRAEALNKINVLGGLGQVSPTTVRLANSLANKVDKKVSANTKYEMLSRLLNGKNTETFEEDLGAKLDAGEITAQDAQFLLAKLKSPNSSEMRKVKIGEKTIDSAFKPSALENLSDKSSAEARRGKAKLMYYEKIGEGLTPEKAQEEVFQEFGRLDSVAASRGIDPSILSNPDAITVTMQGLLQMHRAALASGKTKEAKEIEGKLAILNQQKNILKESGGKK